MKFLLSTFFEGIQESLLKNSSIDLSVIALKLYELIAKGVYKRSIDPLASTEFTYSRFFIPLLILEALSCDVLAKDIHLLGIFSVGNDPLPASTLESSILISYFFIFSFFINEILLKSDPKT